MSLMFWNSMCPPALFFLIKDSSVCFQRVALRNVLGVGLQCWRKGNLKAMFLKYLFLGSEISLLSLFYFSRTITLLHKKVELSRKVARATRWKCKNTPEARQGLKKRGHQVVRLE